MQTTSNRNAKSVPKKDKKQIASNSVKKNSIKPLTFEVNPSVKFIFGHQLMGTQLLQTTRQPLLKQYNSVKSESNKTPTIDLTKYISQPKNEQKNNSANLAKQSEPEVIKFTEKSEEKPNSDSEEEQYEEINMASENSSDENDVNEMDLDLVKRHLNEQAETQKTTISLKTVDDRIDTGFGLNNNVNKQRQLEGFIEKLREDIIQYKKIVEQNNGIIKNMNEEFNNTKEKYSAELELLREELETYKENENVNKKFISSFKELIPMIILTLGENKSVFKTLNTISQDISQIALDPKLLDQERLVKYQFSTNYLSQVIQKINIAKITDLIQTIKKFDSDSQNSNLLATPSRNSVNKYEHQLEKLKAENDILTKQASELEKVMKNIQQSRTARDSGICWSLQEVLQLRKTNEELQNKLDEMSKKYQAILLKPVKPSNIKKLSEILAYIPKRCKQLKIIDEKYNFDVKLEYQNTIKKLESEKDALKSQIQNLEDKIKNLLEKLSNYESENSKLSNENSIMKRQLIELIGIIKVKDEQLQNLKRELEKLKAQLSDLLAKIDKMAKEAYAKDKLFVEKMRDMKEMFDELLKEKDAKIQEIKVLAQKIADLEKIISDLKRELERLKIENENLFNNNDVLTREIERLKSPESLDGFRAMVSLANMILARTKRPPPLSQKDKDLIKDIFSGNVGELLEIIGKSEQENKILKEEVRRGLADKILPKFIFKNYIIVFCYFINTQKKDKNILPNEKEFEVKIWLEDNKKIEEQIAKMIDNDMDLAEKWLTPVSEKDLEKTPETQETAKTQIINNINIVPMEQANILRVMEAQAEILEQVLIGNSDELS